MYQYQWTSAEPKHHLDKEDETTRMPEDPTAADTEATAEIIKGSQEPT